MGVTARSKGNPRGLVNLLRELPLVSPEFDFVALVNSEGEATLRKAGVDAPVHLSRPRTGLAWELGGSASAARAAGASLLYTMRDITFAGFRRSGPAIVLHLHEPPWSRRELARSWPRPSARARTKDALIERLMAPAACRADAVVASSQATADALSERMRFTSQVIHLGIDPVFLGPADGERERFLLHLCSGDGRENTPRVLEAWSRSSIAGFRLVVAGVPARLRPSLLSMAERLGADETVEVRPWLTDQELASLYGRAWGFLGPSLYEGFGLEALEAIARGTPAIAGDIRASREVLGDAAIFVDPHDIASLKDGIMKIVEDRPLWSRLHQAGPERAAGFRWDRTAAALAQTFRQVLQARKQG
jgi:alpha-1,3-rhamnosyl/mannosyltransferase